MNRLESKCMAISVMGPPGAGKTTQSELLARKFDVVHVITSELIKKELYNPHNQNDPIIIREKNIFESGGVCSGEWVSGLILKRTNEIIRSGKGVVYSASPRTLYEAEELMNMLGGFSMNIFMFSIYLDFNVAAERIVKRKLCTSCALPSTGQEICPSCGGKLVTRSLDSEEKLKTRFIEYNKQTEPVIEYLRGRSYEVVSIDGSDSEDQIHKNILKYIK